VRPARVLKYQAESNEVVEREDPRTCEYFFVDVIETAGTSAVPLPRNIFDGEHDRRWIVNRDAGIYDLQE
jgi:hypothetical protein